MVLVLGATMKAAILTPPESSLFPPFRRHFQPLSTPKGDKHACRWLARPPGEAAKPPGDNRSARMSPRHLPHPLRQSRLIITRFDSYLWLDRGWSVLVLAYLCPNAMRSQFDPFENVSPDQITMASTMSSTHS
jgi:hypothetical protein